MAEASARLTVQIADAQQVKNGGKAKTRCLASWKEVTGGGGRLVWPVSRCTQSCVCVFAYRQENRMLKQVDTRPVRLAQLWLGSYGNAQINFATS